jgi:hypothetical protein
MLFHPDAFFHPDGKASGWIFHPDGYFPSGWIFHPDGYVDIPLKAFG